jgi:nitroimidazol reductase NimA-like FMN-containing flavoprotein (pyridoxamine 5'-phosphate oxidase superfamily)
MAEEHAMDQREPVGLEVLESEQCRRLLGESCIGRVAFIAQGRPEVLPVNFWLDGEGSVVFRTAAGSILNEVAGGPATFEIDGYDSEHRTGWSVCVHGTGRVVAAGDVQASPHLRILDIETWAPGHRDVWLAVTAEVVTGRRLPLRATPADLGWMPGVLG